MSNHNRRGWLKRVGVSALGAGVLPGIAAAQDPRPKSRPLDLSEFEPRSMLHVKETHVERAKYPVIDIHTHLSFSARSKNGVSLAGERRFLAPPSYLLPVMDRHNIRALTNLTGGYGDGLKEALQKYDKAYPGRFYTFTEPWYSRLLDADYPKFQAQAIADAHTAGARGLKILKTLGLFLRENITTGKLVKIDDPRFDPMWDACGQLNMPVAIHVSDPLAFFTPTDRFNERYEELNNHPDWSFYGRDFPSNAELLEARNRVFARHPKTQFITLHVGNMAEDLESVGQNLDRFPNMYVDIAARIGELGRQPRTARRFFEKYQDRILFGTDAVPYGEETPQQIYGDKLYEIYFRFLETDDEYFDYAPAKVPPQGRWRIYGIYLPDDILRKVYNGNAAKLLNITV
ncbi:MAG TPA: amidohydrolase family protein [Bryobacteraceae bacterium]|nr:amidohydrolase family protein [Bryobacteraceae bacterium]